MKILVLMLMFFLSLEAYKITNSDGDVIFFIGGENNDRISINCGESVDEDYALKVCGKVLATDFVKDTVSLDFKDSVDSLDGNETNDDHTITFTLELNKASNDDVTFHFETKDDTATDGEDYVGVDDDFTIPAGDTSIDIDITIKGDTDIENDENFDVEITDVSGAELSDSTGSYTIINDEAKAQIYANDDDKSVTEGGDITFKVTLESAVSEDVTFDWDVDFSGYLDSDDFDDDTSGSATISAGDTETTITLSTKDDDLYGFDESFTVTISNPSENSEIKDDTQNCTISTDDTDKPDITIDDPDAEEEGNDIDFTVNVEESEVDISFDFTTTEDTATEGDDYDANSGDDITISAGDTSYTITVSTIDDDDDEDDEENFTVDLSDLKNCETGDDSGKGTITDNDSSGFFSDRRLKTDIKNIDNPLKNIDKINGVKFHWKDKKRFGEQEEIGVIAQEIEKVYPQVVVTGIDGYKRVKYQFLVAPLIEAIKELKKENEDLRKRVERLERAK